MNYHEMLTGGLFTYREINVEGVENAYQVLDPQGFDPIGEWMTEDKASKFCQVENGKIYYRNQLRKVEPLSNERVPAKVKLVNGCSLYETHWLDLNDDSASELVFWLMNNYTIDITDLHK